jgi:PKD repeat protein
VGWYIFSSSSNSIVTLNNGNLVVTNALGNGLLDVRRGAFTMNGLGTHVVADQFVATNGVSSIVIFNGGTLTAKTTTIDTGAVLQFALGTNSPPTGGVVSSNLTLGGTLNITDAGGFTNGTYTLFSYSGTLTYNGVTIDTVPSGCSYAINTNTAGRVNLTAGPPVAGFSASTTIGPVPLAVTFTDTSSVGSITNRYWSFGDGNTTNFATATNPVHTYTTAGTNTVSLTVSGPGGTNTLSRFGYITVTNALAPVITTGLTLTNALLQVGNVAVVVAGDTNAFSVVATNLGPGTLSYQWSFGDGVTNVWSSSGAAEHAYTNNCGPYTASVTISNGWAATSSNLIVTVACELTVTKMQMKLNLNLAKTNSDSCTLTATMEDLAAGYNLTNKVVTVDVGGAQVPFTLDAKGKGKGVSHFGNCKLVRNKKTGLWTLKVKFAKGAWRTQWSEYGLENTTTSKAPVTIPVIMLIDSEAFAVEHPMLYTAKAGKSGSAK